MSLLPRAVAAAADPTARSASRAAGRTGLCSGTGAVPGAIPERAKASLGATSTRGAWASRKTWRRRLLENARHADHKGVPAHCLAPRRGRCTDRVPGGMHRLLGSGEPPMENCDQFSAVSAECGTSRELCKAGCVEANRAVYDFHGVCSGGADGTGAPARPPPPPLDPQPLPAPPTSPAPQFPPRAPTDAPQQPPPPPAVPEPSPPPAFPPKVPEGGLITYEPRPPPSPPRAPLPPATPEPPSPPPPLAPAAGIVVQWAEDGDTCASLGFESITTLTECQAFQDSLGDTVAQENMSPTACLRFQNIDICDLLPRAAFSTWPRMTLTSTASSTPRGSSSTNKLVCVGWHPPPSPPALLPKEPPPSASPSPPPPQTPPSPPPSPPPPVSPSPSMPPASPSTCPGSHPYVFSSAAGLRDRCCATNREGVSGHGSTSALAAAHGWGVTAAFSTSTAWSRRAAKASTSSAARRVRFGHDRAVRARPVL